MNVDDAYCLFQRNRKPEPTMTQDNLGTRPHYPEIGGHVLDIYGHSFGKITAVHPDSDEIVVRSNKGVYVTISGVSIYYEGGGEYMLIDDIDLDDAIEIELEPEPVPEPTLTGVDALLAERETRYGAFRTHSEIAQGIKRAMQGEHVTTHWYSLEPYQIESLELIAHKIARILNGDPNYADNWVDIAGYAQLVANELENN